MGLKMALECKINRNNNNYTIYCDLIRTSCVVSRRVVAHFVQCTEVMTTMRGMGVSRLLYRSMFIYGKCRLVDGWASR